MNFPIQKTFQLSDQFIEKYKSIRPDFGFNGLGELVFFRTYSRIKPDGKNEAWYETVRRVVEGIYSVQRQHIEDHGLGWNQTKAQKSAQEMYDRIFNFKMLPSGRALWAMGAPVIMEKGLTAALFNCSYVSTKDLDKDPTRPFCVAMDQLMCGVGVGADTLGAGKVKIKNPKGEAQVTISDDREGWVLSLKQLLEAYFLGKEKPVFDYSIIRPAGQPIKTFGGTASGPQPLMDLHNRVDAILSQKVGELLSARDIVDIFNLIGRTVVAGNVRRSAELLLGDPTDEFLDLKNYEKNPERAEWGWASNNSIYATLGMDYAPMAERIRKNGEPGFYWLENAREYGRIRDSEKNNKDFRVNGANPCMEIMLEPYELCNLVETFPTHHENIEDYKRTIKFAYLFGKTITLLPTHWEETNRVILRNRRIGLSITGIAQFVEFRGIAELKEWMEEGYKTVEYYDDVYSDWLAVPKSKKLTTIKPSGTLSLLAGVTPGVHYPESKYYIRRVRLANSSPFIPILKDAGYHVEPAKYQEDSTSVAEFPVYVGEMRTLREVGMWEQLCLAAFCQEHWADNSVSVTITFDPETEGKDIEKALNYFQYKLKGVSFLPRIDEGSYPQMPYEAITKERYEEMVSGLKLLDFSKVLSEADAEKYCTNDYCAI